MGRYYYSKKEEADSLKQVNVSFLNKNGYFKWSYKSGTVTWSRNGEKAGSIGIQAFIDENEQFIRFNYTQTDRFSGEKTDLDYKIPLTNTACHFGGKRYWFVCPWYANGRYCGKRVGVLYLSGKYFACRHCNDLSYNSRNLGGIAKVAGQVISFPDLEKLASEIKRKYYRGKITRKYMRFIKKQKKSDYQLRVMARVYGGI